MEISPNPSSAPVTNSPVEPEMASPTGRRVERFEFWGDANEYFGIWFVNNLLTWLTLGIYSAWAKVRNLQYFYGNTELMGGSFQFTASPLKILRSRIIAVLLLALYVTVDNLGTTLAKIVLVSMIAAYFIFAPVLTIFVMSFRLRHSEWRGIQFRFNKDYAGAYRVYLPPISLMAAIGLSLLLPYNSSQVEEFFGMEPHVVQEESFVAEDGVVSDLPLEQGEDIYPNDDVADMGRDDHSGSQEVDGSYEVEDSYGAEDTYQAGDELPSYFNPYFFIPAAILTLVFLALLPFFDFINTRFLSRNVRLGSAPFVFVARAKDYYHIYGLWLAALVVFAGLWTLEGLWSVFSHIGLLWVLILASIFAIPASRAYFKSKRYNLLLSNTVVDNKHRLHANTPFLSFLLLMITNSVVVALTLGLMGPWAQVRTARFLMQYSSIEVEGQLDDFVAHQQGESSALAEEVADMFDLDVI